MTNATEQTRITMYDAFTAMKAGGRWLIKKENCEAFESAMEAHLEALRLELDRWKLSDKKTGEMILFKQGEAQREREQHQETERRLHLMTQDRDDCQKRMQAVDHAHFNLDQANKVAGEELRKAQEQARRDRQDCIEAEKLSDSLDERLRDAQAVIGRQEQLITGQRLAIADLYLAKQRAPKAEEGLRESAPCDNTMTILGAVVDCQQIVSDWAVYGHKSKDQMRKLANVLNGDPELQRAMRAFEKGDCMHSFHPAFPGGEQCIFCGVKKS